MYYEVLELKEKITINILQCPNLQVEALCCTDMENTRLGAHQLEPLDFFLHSSTIYVHVVKIITEETECTFCTMQAASTTYCLCKDVCCTY